MIVIPYTPHAKQAEIHSDPSRFKVIAAGRRFGKTITLVNEHILQALNHPQKQDGPVQRSWYVCTTYRQAEMVAWRTALNFLPPELIATKQVNKLSIELINGHIMEFKGSEDYDKLRGVGLCWVGIDEYGLMKPEVWGEVLRPMLIESKGGAMFIGTPGPDGSPHFQDLFNRGKSGETDWKSWHGFTADNTTIEGLKEEIEKAKKDMPPDIFKREFEADFTTGAGLVYDNFKHSVHVIPNYQPDPGDFIVGSIDPGLHNPTAAILIAWDRDGVGRVFREYYVEGKLASENALAISKMAGTDKVAYWVIDRSSTRRDPASGMTVMGKYRDAFKESGQNSPIITAPNDPGSVWAGIDETKKLFEQKRLLISVLCHKTLWELGRYIMYKRRHFVEKNEEEKPRKLHDHAMDCLKNAILTRPWTRRNVQVIQPRGLGY